MEGVGGRIPTLTEGTQDMSVSTVRIERSINSLVKGEIPQMQSKACKHSLRSFPVKRDVGKLPV